MKKLIPISVLALLLLAGCEKYDTLQQNNIKIVSVEPTYTTANDCTTSGGLEGTFFTYDIKIENPKNEVPYRVEVDVMRPTDNGYFSYKYSDFQLVNAQTIRWQQCRTFIGDWVELRFFIMTEDEKRSSFKTIRINKPQ